MLALLFTAPVAAQPKNEPLVDQVKTAIERGVSRMRQIQRNDGSWEIAQELIGRAGGQSTMAMLALLNCGVPTDDPMMANGLRYLRGLQPDTVYVRALQTMVFAEAGLVEDKERITANVKWLMDASVKKDGLLQGWSYHKAGPTLTTDNSNTQYAILGLYAGHTAGAAIPKDTWEAIRAFYIRTQLDDGGWIYRPDLTKGASITMTVAGLCGLIMTDLALVNDVELDATGRPKKCREQRDSAALAEGLNWLGRPGQFYLVPQEGRTLYNMYGIERAGRLSGMRFLAGRDWYREGCQFLVRNQMQDGSWSLRTAYDQWEVVSTSFALLFLSKGRTPVLISKLAHGAWPRRNEDVDWNLHRHDIRNLTEYCSKNLFKKMTLNWQVFDLMRGATPRPGSDTLTEEDLNDVTSDLLQTPIVYISGQNSPLLRFSAVERDLLKRYVDNGGFIVAEACHDSPNFDDGFKALCRKLWPDNPLEPLSGLHPIWSAHHAVKPGDPFQLWGIQMGCKTVLVYSPQGFSCIWDSNSQAFGVGKQAFELGANIVAYATGMEPPKPRLTPVEVARSDSGPSAIPRGFLKVAQLKHRGDWQPAPNAMRNLMSHVNKLAGLDVVLKTDARAVYGKEIIDYKFLYMHGRADFQFAEEELGNLRFNLENGGLLLADACCGSDAFDRAFRKLARQLFPKHELEQVPLNDYLFSKDLNQLSALTDENIQCRTERNGPMRRAAPFLEGVRINNRWVLLYSKYDLGCALERHNAADCVGYNYESAKLIASAAVLYLFDPFGAP